MKRGFTLIELLAVIVILAIIALIATPIVLNIINETKESASLRSAEMYLDSVEQSIARSMLQNKYITDGTYNITKDGDICLENFDSTNKTCPDINTLKVEVDGEKPDGGTITIENVNIKNITINLDNKTIGNGKNGEMVYDLPSTLCKRIEGPAKEIGTKYQCKVKDNMEEGFEDGYYFYVLSKENDNSLNLILDRNVYYDEVTNTRGLTDEGHLGSVDWINAEDYGDLAPYDEEFCWDENGCVFYDKGPITAMNYLEKATSSWTNLQKMTISEFGVYEWYGDLVRKQTMQTYNTYARLPKYDEIIGAGCDEPSATTVLSCPIWLVDYLDDAEEDFGEDYQQYPLNNIYGYWISSAFWGDGFEAFDGAWNVIYDGSMGWTVVNNSSNEYSFVLGIRPVINVQL